MRLHTFITGHLEEILIDWVAFARQQKPAATLLDEPALLDHGKLILEEIAADMQRPQREDQRRAKSEGNSAEASRAITVPSRSHARQRENQGFEIVQLIAEYRALRATVLRRWSAFSDEVQLEDLEDVTRFNEAVDQALAESVEVFVAEVGKTRDLFLGVLSHDLRGPLSAIAASAALAARMPGDQTRPMSVIARSVAQMGGLIDDLVEYTRHQLGRELPIVPARLQLDHFVRDMLEETAAISAGKTLSVETSGDMSCELDARRLHQALSNLVFNAVKYAIPGTPIRVLVNGDAANQVILAVENVSKPIPSELLSTLFDPLVRGVDGEPDGDPEVAGANLGLGLFVVRKIAVAHGGTASGFSDESVTHFEMQLPRFVSRG